MKQKDHRRLAKFLISLCPEKWKGFGKKTMFLSGSMLPDYNPFTYMRGGKMEGHNTKYSAPQIRYLSVRLQGGGVRSLRDCYAFGAFMHYLADSFTYPHTELYKGTMNQHRTYECELRKVFGTCLENMKQVKFEPLKEPVSDYLKREKQLYEASERDLIADGMRIIRICTTVYISVF